MRYIPFFFIILLLSACYTAHRVQNIGTEPVFEDRTQALSEGATLYQQNCATCHGKLALGNGNQALRLEEQPVNLYVIAETHSVNAIAARISSGKGHSMPGFNDALTEDEIWKISFYVKQLAN